METETQNPLFEKYPVFKLIQKSKQNQTITFREKLQIYNNWPCLFVGVFYYLYHKMFKKVAVYIPAGYFLAVFLVMIDHDIMKKMEIGQVGLVFACINLVCFFRANVDLFKTKIENNTGFW